MTNRLHPRGYTICISGAGQRATKRAFISEKTGLIDFEPVTNVAKYFYALGVFHDLDAAQEQLTALAHKRDKYIIRAAPIEGLDPAAKHQRLLSDDGKGGIKSLEPCPRSWVRVDFDGVYLGEGFERPGLFVYGAAIVRDRYLGANWEGVACIAGVSARSAFAGPGHWRGTLTFMLSEPVPDVALEKYFIALKNKNNIALDPCLARSSQQNFTGRCIFAKGTRDPFAPEEWVQRVPARRGYGDVVKVNGKALVEKYNAAPLITKVTRSYSAPSSDSLAKFTRRVALIGRDGDGSWHNGVVSAVACAAQLGIDAATVRECISEHLAAHADGGRQGDYGDAYVERTYDHYVRKSAAADARAEASLKKLNAILNRVKGGNK